MRELVLAVKPERAPLERTVYSDLGFLILGFIAEEILQMPLDQALERWVIEPMGLNETWTRRVTSQSVVSHLDHVAPTEDCPWRGGLLKGLVHDDNCWSMGGYGGHAGFFSTARDVLFSVYRLWTGFLDFQVLSHLWSPAPPPHQGERTWGWDRPDAGGKSSAGQFFSRNTVGHLGFTGTSLWIDLSGGFAVTLLTNRVCPDRSNEKIRTYRPHFHDAARSLIFTSD